MNNPFDLALLEDDENYELDGLFSSLKKSVKKLNPLRVAKKSFKGLKKGAKSVHKAHIRAVKNPKAELKRRGAQVKKHVKDVDRFRMQAERKIDRTLYGRKLGDKLLKIRHSKEARQAERVVGAAVATYFGGPLVGKAIMGAGKTAAGAAIKSAAVKAAPKMISSGVSIYAKRAMAERQARANSQREKLEIAKAKSAIYGELGVDSKTINALKNDKDFQRVIEGLIRSGASWPEIEAAWANSDAYQLLVRKEVPKTVQPMIYQDMVSQGIPRNVAQRESYIQSHEMVDQAADKIAAEKSGFDAKTLLAIGVPVATILLTGA